MLFYKTLQLNNIVGDNKNNEFKNGGYAFVRIFI